MAVQARWQLMFGGALCALVGLVAMTGFHADRSLVLIQVGLGVTAAAALFALVTRTQHRGPAAIGLIGLGPMVQVLMEVPVRSLSSLILYMGLKGVLFFAGLFTTIIISVLILVMRVPARATDDESLARAEVRH